MLLKEQSSVLLKVQYVDFTNDILMLNNVDVILLKEQSHRFDERRNCA